MKNLEKLSKESNHDFALRTIKENIINLELKPGTLISEQDIANELNLSRTPVHEALQELSKTQIIEIMPQKGSLVSLINMNLIDEAVFMRSTIESAVTEEACRIASPEEILALEENVNLQEFYETKQNYDKIWILDNDFHKMMYKITGKMLCYYTIKTMNIHFDRYRELRLQTSNPSKIINEHKAMLEAFKNKNSEDAKSLIKKHLTRHYEDEQELRQKYPSYFL